MVAPVFGRAPTRVSTARKGDRMTDNTATSARSGDEHLIKDSRVDVLLDRLEAAEMKLVKAERLLADHLATCPDEKARSRDEVTP